MHGDALEHHIIARRAHWAERGQRGSEEAGTRLVVWPVCAGVAQAHERWDGAIGCPVKFGHDRTELRPSSRGCWLAGMVPVKHLSGVVVALVADQRAHDYQFVHDSRQARKSLADLDTR